MGKKRTQRHVVPRVLSVWEIEEQRLKDETLKVQAEYQRAQMHMQRVVAEVADQERKYFALTSFAEAPISAGADWNIGGSFPTEWQPHKLLINENPVPEFPCQPVIETWHGTKLKNLSGIAQYSLRAGRSRCMFGKGIYSTRDKGKAFGYGTCANRSLVILLRCSVAVGNVFHTSYVTRSMPIGLDHEYQSIYAGGGQLDGAWGGYIRGEEFVVPNASQVHVQAIYVWRKVVGAQAEAPPVKQRFGAKNAAAHHRRKKAEAQDTTPKRRNTAIPGHPCHRLVTLSPWRATSSKWVLCRHAEVNRKGLYRCNYNMPTDNCESCKRFGQPV